MTFRRVAQTARWMLAAGVFVVACAQAAPMTTAAQVKLYTLSTGEATRERSKDIYTGDLTETKSNPAVAQSVLSFDKFDTSLGTLLGVDFSWSKDGGRRSLSFEVTGTETDGYDNHADALFTLALSGAGLITVPAQTQTLHVKCSILAITGCTDAKGIVSAGAVVTTFQGLEPLLGNFAGPGTFDLTAQLTADITDLTDPDNGTSIARANARSTGSLSLV